MSHVTSHMFSCVSTKVTCLISHAYVDPWDMLNNYCFHAYAQMLLFMGVNVNGFFLRRQDPPL